MTTIIYKHALETVSNLNADLGSKTEGEPSATAGTYALINDMISNLSSIKSSMKAQEKIISARLTALAVASEVVTDAAVVNLPMTAANFQCKTGPGNETTSRYEGNPLGDSNTLPAVLITNSKNYSESAVFGVLAGACKLITELKDGTLTDSNAPDITATTLTNT